MALQASGNPIKYSQIAGEFGYPSYKNLNNSLGAYRVSETYGTLTGLALDNTISGATITPAMPQSGTIKFSDFYSKKLNMIVDYYTASQFPFSRTTTGTYFNAYQKYGASTSTNNFVNVVGGFTSRPYPDPGGKQVFIHVNGTIGSKAGSDLYVALTTGKDWNSTTRIQIDVGSSGRITGSGGQGGDGGNPGGNGLPGSSALGIEHTGTTTLVNRGYVICGYGGGGGGAYSQVHVGGKNPLDYSAGGGGGGGGAGLPAGAGGSGQTGTQSNGAGGGSGTLTVGGAGGGGGSSGPASGSAGGKGGDINSAAGSPSGTAGANGNAIVKASTIGSFNYINTGSGVSAGSTTAVGIPE